ncbi:MAG: ribokinase [Pseudomonadales bacterium]|nr:ribokinase [Pseudomonadales bacterium]
MAIVNFGSFIIDHVYRVPHFVRPGETLPATGYRVFAGGKGFNQTLALARAGATASGHTLAHAGAIGENGRWLLELLRREGVDVRDVVVTDTPTGHGIIQVNDQGENAILQFPGANRTLERDHIERVLARYGPEDVLLLQNEVNALAQLIRTAVERGLRVVLNPAPMDTTIAGLPLERVWLLIVNEVEGFDLTGSRDPDEILARLGRRCPDSRVVLTLGAAGARCVHQGRQYQVDAWPAQAIDTTGAGDTFTGFFVASLLAGQAIGPALERAARAAALCVARHGAADSIPTATEVDALT